MTKMLYFLRQVRQGDDPQMTNGLGGRGSECVLGAGPALLTLLPGSRQHWAILKDTCHALQPPQGPLAQKGTVTVDYAAEVRVNNNNLENIVRVAFPGKPAYNLRGSAGN